MTALDQTSGTDDAALALLIARFQALPKPKPSAGMEAYDRELELALSTRSGCRENYARYLAGARRTDLDYLPIKLDIENVSRCNFRCTMCSVSEWTKGQRAGDMSLSLIHISEPTRQ